MRQPVAFARCHWPSVLAALWIAAAPGTASLAAASPPASRVVGELLGPGAATLGVPVDLVLRLRAIGAGPETKVEVVPAPEWQVVSGPLPWSGALAAGDVVEVPLTVLLTGSGEYSVALRLTTGTIGAVERSSVILNVLAGAGSAELSREPHLVMKLRRASGPADLARLSLARPKRGAGRAAPPPPVPGAASGTVSGTAAYTDPEGFVRPIRGAHLEIYDGAPGGQVIFEGLTDLQGAYTAPVTAASGQVSVRVFSEDGDGGSVVVVYPPDHPDIRYFLQAGPKPLAGAVHLDLVADPTTRGQALGTPDTGTMLASRAFSVYDAAGTYWFQALALTTMQRVRVVFPGPVSAVNLGTLELNVERGHDADWDVIGHEFFHVVQGCCAPRPIVRPGGGAHTFGQSAIGLDGRGREAGAQLAWNEGLATFFALAVQRVPLDSPVPFPPGLLHFGDDVYTDTKAGKSHPAEMGGVGYADEATVLGFLWDLFDTHQDANGPARDTIALGGNPARAVWDAVTHDLPCECVSLGDTWDAIVAALGPTDPGVLEAGALLSLNRAGALAVGPSDDTAVVGPLPPTFSWKPQGDPSSSHRNDQFILAFSRDGFQSHLVKIEVPGTGLTSYTPTAAEWQQVVFGASVGATFQWLVAARRGDDPLVPPGGYWYSNRRTFAAGEVHIRMTWDNPESDVDLHVAAPSGEEIYFGTPVQAWGYLDQDCIFGCTEENIRISRFLESGLYYVYAHYYEDCGHGPSTVLVQVFVSGVEVYDDAFVLFFTGDFNLVLAQDVVATPLRPVVSVQPVVEVISKGGGPLPRRHCYEQ